MRSLYRSRSAMPKYRNRASTAGFDGTSQPSTQRDKKQLWNKTNLALVFSQFLSKQPSFLRCLILRLYPHKISLSENSLYIILSFPDVNASRMVKFASLII